MTSPESNDFLQGEALKEAATALQLSWKISASGKGRDNIGLANVEVIRRIHGHIVKAMENYLELGEQCGDYPSDSYYQSVATETMLWPAVRDINNCIEGLKRDFGNPIPPNQAAGHTYGFKDIQEEVIDIGLIGDYFSGKTGPAVYDKSKEALAKIKDRILSTPVVVQTR